jgi:hypothetical protein
VQEGEKGIHHIKVMTKVNIQAAGARQEKQTGRKARSRRGSLPKQHVCIEKKKKKSGNRHEGFYKVASPW